MVNIAKGFQTLSDGVSEGTKAQAHPFLIPYLENILDQTVHTIVWLQGLDVVEEMEGEMSKNHLECWSAF